MQDNRRNIYIFFIRENLNLFFCDLREGSNDDREAVRAIL
jgi:hypothetical protein